MRGLLLVLGLTMAVPAQAAEFQHVLLVFLDDVGTDKIASYAADASNPTEDRPVTPTLDLLGTAGVRFTDAWATPVCSPTRAMVLAGGYPYRTGIGYALGGEADVRLGTVTDTLMKLAQDNGLRTGLFGKFHLGTGDDTLEEEGTVFGVGAYPIHLGFDYFAGNMLGAVAAYDDWLYTVSAPVHRTGHRYLTTATQMSDPATGVNTDDAIRWMEDAPGRRRFTVVSYNLAHDTPVRSGAGRWDNGAQVCGAKPDTDTENMKVMVECLDAAVYDLLRGTPGLDDTLVVVLSDNGTDDPVAEGYYADGRGKGSTYENGIRVPFWIADGAAINLALRTGGPLPPWARFRIDAGTTSGDPASVVDVYATIADLLDLSSRTCTPGATCGRDSLSLRQVLTGGPALRTDVWSETWVAHSDGFNGHAAVRAGDVKLVIDVPRGEACRSYEIYDLAADRWETTDLYDDPAYAVEQAQLLGLLAGHEAAMNTAWIPPAVCP